MAAALLEQASRRLETVKREVKTEGYAYSVRSAQECVELSLKAALRLVGVEYPKKHDLSRVLLKVKERFPAWFEVKEFAKVSRDLAEKREPAMYGDESRRVPSTAIFDKDEAKKALDQAKKIYDACSRLLKGVASR